ncbi:putative protein S-acyltransferase 23 isoform X2 [Tasmannia lanceolata]|uniref:putative protein S-acyltransferase 23 isoform X2 n=1 Tax=Tasmannia lanceolata TaxID=3420 RepID=UPI004063A68C
MASHESEIQLVSDSKNPQNSTSTNKNPNDNTIIDIFSASAYGNFEKLLKFVEEDGASLSKPDGNGYYALQWASLNNYTNIVQYIIEHGGDINAADNMEQTALHWAAVRGSVAVVDMLLQNGARVEAADVNGYRAVHVAAQYGQTGFLNHIITRYGADFDPPDKDGRSPLHWAAYKGFADTIRLLLFRDAYQGRQDKDGCTPLHWAAISGNVEACTILVHAGTKQELMVKDNAGFTPSQLASDKGHRHVAFFLDPLLNIDLNYSSVWTGNWSQLCPTCKIIRPVRSKHCPSCKHCVEQFDHHCPWISNCVGKRNKWDFFVFVCMATLSTFIAAVVAVQRIWTEPVLSFAGTWTQHLVTQHPGAITFLVLDVVLLLAGAALTTAQASQIARNITTNELANAARYTYLRDPEGRFRNPYNHGFRKNCTDFLIRGYSEDDEITWPSLQQATH